LVEIVTVEVGTMNWKIKAGIALLVVGALAGGALVVGKNRSRPAVTVMLRIGVTPREQSDFVIAQGNSARFKYLVGKQAVVKPGLAQKLSIKTVPNSSLVEARVGVLTKAEARRYVEVFVETLQEQCGGRAQLALAEQSIR
jgi:hypothetical protein